MRNNSTTYECSTKNFSYVTTSKVFRISLRGREHSSQWRGWENLLGEFVTNSSLRLKLDICIMELSILFSKDILFLYYVQVIGFWFLWEKSIFLIHFSFILPWICPWFHDVSYMIHNSFFSPKIQKTTFTNQFDLLIFYFRLKTKLFSRFY